MALDRLAEATRSVSDVSGVAQSLADKDVLVLDGTEWSFRSNLVREIAYTRLTKRDRFWRHSGIAFYLEEHKDDGRYGRPDDWLIETIGAALPGGGAPHPRDRRRRQRRRRRPDTRGRCGGCPRRHVGPRTPRRGPLPSGSTAKRSSCWLQRLRTRSPEPAWSAERFGLLLGRARARGEVRDFEGARDDGLAALALAELSADPRATSQALVRLGVAEVRSGRLKSGDDALSEGPRARRRPRRRGGAGGGAPTAGHGVPDAG